MNPERPLAFNIMAKPRGSICNLDCEYCYFLSKERLYPDSNFSMSDDMLETYTRQYIEAQQVPEVTFAWQGGEPTLMGLEFFERAVTFQEQFARPGMHIANALQTNGTQLDETWCEFLKAHNFLIGISIDGPPHLHDVYRVNKGGAPSSGAVLRGLELLKRYEVDFNILCTVHAANQDHGLEVYRYFRDELDAAYMQFIPIVERDNDTGFQEGSTVTDRSVTGDGYGRFLTEIFDEWVRKDVGRVFAQIFDVSLGQWAYGRSSLCVFSATCGDAMVLEHNGDIYACDHFVEPNYLLGNLNDIDVIPLVVSEEQHAFGQAKRDTLPQYCLDCEVRFVCNGGCPKNRFITTPDGEAGLNYLCAGYRAFFNHIDPSMRYMADQLKQHKTPASIMRWIGEQDEADKRRFASTGRNDPCPCGSGRKFKHCHGRVGVGLSASEG